MKTEIKPQAPTAERAAYMRRLYTRYHELTMRQENRMERARMMRVLSRYAERMDREGVSYVG